MSPTTALIAIGAMGVLLVGALVAGIAWSARRRGVSETQREVLDRGIRNREEVDAILAEPIPLGKDLRDRMRARRRRALDKLRDRLGE